ncbi:SLAP domain-containing protein [Companilactobacillus kimchiensis]|uniref:S-layer protein C-terminal domain-containing protein n=1 Tax=Companilactobacillus kimchiensis TaxID=993692 RepID=A0A0R2LG64_9LACO|nr:SLAP domain-containing protein [Companilactobacillus kimchiensis]KRN97703.1 hypothetical protein IV57_GL001627 [Companilactobacillus kimchiensis]
MIKYMGITAVMLLAVAPVGMSALDATTTVVSAESEADTDNIKPDSTYTDNGDGTYTLHGTISAAEVWSGGQHSHPTGTALPFSIEGKKVNSLGEIKITDVPTFAGYKLSGAVAKDPSYFLMLKDGNVYIYTFLIFEPADGSTIDMTNKTPGVAYSTVITLGNGYNGIYTDSGLPITVSGTKDFVKLPAGSAWKVDRKMRMYGETYYRIGNNEWIDRTSGTETTINPNVVTTKNQATLYTEKGVKSVNRALAANTPWYTDRSAIINGQKMYRVSTDEWVSADDIK